MTADNANLKFYEQPDVKDSFTPEMIGHIQNRGLADKTATEVAAEMIKAHREAEKFVGVPADKLIRMPKDAADEAGLKEFYKKLGVPDTADGYDFSAIKKADGTADTDLADRLKQIASGAKLTKDAATSVGAEVKKFLDEKQAADQANYQAKINTERADLQKEWGGNFEAFKLAGAQTIAKLGISAEAVAALEKQAGYAAVMKMAYALAVKTGEDKLIRGDNPNNGGTMSLEQARAKKAELMLDKAWVKKHSEGDAAARREMLALDTLIVQAS